MACMGRVIHVHVVWKTVYNMLNPGEKMQIHLLSCKRFSSHRTLPPPEVCRDSFLMSLQSSVNLGPTLDIDNLKDPEQFFFAFERLEEPMKTVNNVELGAPVAFPRKVEQ
ncbi:hypothetical protein NC652_001935 [Populus alba x Populus x berolinensis]|nr:hypothetical protein NC652_001935 [Populus alba x Populus x berolinensis]